MLWPGFVGGSYVSRSVNVNAERSINLYPEIVDAGTPKVKTWLVGTPGLKGFVNFSGKCGGPVRALFAMNGRAFAVVGQNFCEFFPHNFHCLLHPVFCVLQDILNHTEPPFRL